LSGRAVIETTIPYKYTEKNDKGHVSKEDTHTNDWSGLPPFKLDTWLDVMGDFSLKGVRHGTIADVRQVLVKDKVTLRVFVALPNLWCPRVFGQAAWEFFKPFDGLISGV
jgi:hypothetical protein